jgi:hypothetical protein
VTTAELSYVLGIVTGLVLGFSLFYPWGRRNGHLDGYQDHRDETRRLKDQADERKQAGAELEIRAKTAPARPPAAVPGGGRPFPPASPRTHTAAAHIAPVTVPPAGPTVMIRPQPGRDSGAGTVTMPRARTTGEMQQITADTETIIRGIIAGTWPPPRADSPPFPRPNGCPFPGGGKTCKRGQDCPCYPDGKP